MGKKSRARNRSKKQAAKARAAAPAPVNVITDRRGVVFDKEKHAHMPDGTPHTDSAGHFIGKADHYQAQKKTKHYPDSYSEH